MRQKVLVYKVSFTLYRVLLDDQEERRVVKGKEDRLFVVKIKRSPLFSVLLVSWCGWYLQSSRNDH